MWRALFPGELCAGHDATQRSVAGGVAGQQREVAAVVECEFGAGDGPDAGGGAGPRVRDEAGQRVVVGQG